ncbi:hypothetical protein AADG42_04900 [Ammonicoccus fulvus]|uniref:Transposase n=1 Tax=Ammonicoccus fulvus TaxID=3138240 RepID=A0ABZ3FKV1_9ACTN
MEPDVAGLYAGPLQDFVARRGRLAAELKAAGDAAGAKRVLALRKPTRGAWLVNLLAFHDADRLSEVFELGASLAKAHRDADPTALRELSALRAGVLDALAGRAAALGSERGYAVPDHVRGEVVETLRAAMADPALADRVLEGAMAATVRAAGFGPADLFAPAEAGVGMMAEVIPLRPATKDETPAAPGPDMAEIRRLSRELGRAEARLEDARERRTRADEEVQSVQAECDEQESRTERLASEIADLQRRLDILVADRAVEVARLEGLRSAMAEKMAFRDRAEAEVAELSDVIEAAIARLTDLGLET